MSLAQTNRMVQGLNEALDKRLGSRTVAQPGTPVDDLRRARILEVVDANFGVYKCVVLGANNRAEFICYAGTFPKRAYLVDDSVWLKWESTNNPVPYIFGAGGGSGGDLQYVAVGLPFAV